MKQWLALHILRWYEALAAHREDLLSEHPFTGERVCPSVAAGALMRAIKFPWFKPAAFMTIDDRAVTFTGLFPSIEEIQAFKPWNKK